MSGLIKTLSMAGFAALVGTGVAPLYADPPAPASVSASDTAQAPNASVAARISTLGLGVEGSYLAAPNVGLRLGFNTYSYSHNTTYQSVNYDGKLKLNNITALADFYPSENGTFHVTGGFLINNNKLTAHGKPNSSVSGQTFTLNGTTYSVADVGGVDGNVKFSNLSPYLGLGFGKPAAPGSGLSFLFDLGVVFQGKPSLSLTRSGGTTDPTLSSQINASLNAQRNKTQSDVNKFQYYPVISFGLAYHF